MPRADAEPKHLRSIARFAITGMLASAMALLAPSAGLAASGWTIVDSPNATSTQNYLNGVACVSASDCVAVGYSFDGVYRTLIERDTGSGWAIVNSPNPGSTSSVLQAVTCVSASDCWAVGDYTNNGNVTIQTLIEHYDGSVWSTVSSPNTNHAQNNLNGVTCVGASDCWAVGYSSNVTVIEHYDGTVWSIVSSPSTSSPSNFLYSVTCVSATDCWTVGDALTSSQQSQTLIEHYTAGAWSIVNSPNATSTTNHLGGVSCASTNDCWAVGFYDSNFPFLSLIEHYTESGWSVVSSPNPSSSENILSAVTCAGDTGCWAVGQYIYGTGSGVTGTLIEHDTESGWAVVLSPNNDNSNNELSGVTCFVNCWAVGSSYDSGPNVIETLVEEYGPQTSTFEDSSPSVSYDSWRGVVDPSASGGTYRIDAVRGGVAALTYAGTEITWITRKGPDQGIVTVTIDGESQGNIDLYAPKAHEFSLEFSQSDSGPALRIHRIVITVTGTKDARSTGTGVVVDAFVVGSTTIQDASTRVTYDTWRGAPSSSASGGTYRISRRAGATASLTFTGTTVDWITATCPACGMARVSVDGVDKGTVDLYSSRVVWKVSESFGGLSSGSHTIVVTVLRTKNASSTAALVVMDAFVVHA